MDYSDTEIAAARKYNNENMTRNTTCIERSEMYENMEIVDCQCDECILDPKFY